MPTKIDFQSTDNNSPLPALPYFPINSDHESSTPATLAIAGDEDKKTPLHFAENVATSTGHAVGSIGHILFGNNLNEAFNPVAGVKHVYNDVLKPFGNLAAGAVMPKTAAAPAPGEENLPTNQSSPQTKTFEQFGDQFLGGALKGNLKGSLDKAYNDPAGFLLDIAQLADILPGGSKVAETINPVTKAAEAGGAIIDKVGSKIEAPFKGSVNTPAIEAAGNIGMDATKDLPLSAQTTNKFVQGAEALSSRTLFGAQVRDAVEAARANVNEFITNTVQELKPEALSNTTLGGIIKTGFENFKDTFEKNKNAMYDAFTSKAKEAPAFTGNTTRSLQDIIEREGKSMASNTLTDYFQKMLDKINGTDQTIREQGISDADAAKMGLNPELTFENLKQTRTDVGNLLKNRTDPFTVGHKANLENLYASLSDDMDASVNAIDPALGKELKNVTDYYSKGINKINSKLGKVITNATPEELVSNFVKPNNATNLQDLRAIVGDDTMANIGSSFLNKIMNQATSADGVFNVKQFKNILKTYDKETLNEILTPEQGGALTDAMDKLENAKTVQDALKAGVKTAEGSQTAFNQRIFDTLTKMAQLGAGAFGLATGNFLLVAKSIFGEYTGTKLITSEWGKKWLTDGFDTKVGKTVQKYAPEVGRAGQVANALQEATPPKPEDNSAPISPTGQIDFIPNK